MKSVAAERRRHRLARRRRVRARVHGTAARPRLAVYRSNTGVCLQLIDDTVGKTLVAVYDRGLTGKGKRARAEAAGKKVAELAGKQGIKAAVFDRGGFRYHGRIAAVADGARAGGLKV
ncbi:MAG: 50S ribosomal protein L18 [Candidatus Andersenbacteria bacterium]